MARRKVKTDAEKSIPEMVGEVMREEMRQMYKDGKLTAYGRRMSNFLERALPDEKVDEWGWSLSRKERAEIKRRAVKKTDPNADTSVLESKIDQLVYKLYGLTDNEIAIVEGRNETKQKPQGETAHRSAASPRRRRQATTPPAPPAPTDDEVLE